MMSVYAGNICEEWEEMGGVGGRSPGPQIADCKIDLMIKS